MCLAIPGKIVETYQANGMKMGKIEYGGTLQEACLEYCPEAEVDEYVIVHAGFAISVLDEEEAKASLSAWAELEEAERQLRSQSDNTSQAKS